MPEKQEKLPTTEKQSEAKPAPRVLAPPSVVREPPKPVLPPADLLAAQTPDESLSVHDPAATPERQADRLKRVDQPVRNALVSRWQNQRGNAYVQRLLKRARTATTESSLPSADSSRQAPVSRKPTANSASPAAAGHTPRAPDRTPAASHHSSPVTRPNPVQRAIPVGGVKQKDYGGQTPEHLLKLKEPQAAYDKLKEVYLKDGKLGVHHFIRNTGLEMRTANQADADAINLNLTAQQITLNVVADATVLTFGLSAHVTVNEMLSASDAAIRKEQERYGLAEGLTDDPVLKMHIPNGEYTMSQEGDAAEMAAAAKQLAQEYKELIELKIRVRDEIAEQVHESTQYGGSSNQKTTPLDEMPQVVEATKKYEGNFSALAAKFPVLATYKQDPDKLASFAAQGTSPAAATMLGKDLKDKLKNIQETRNNLNSGKLKIWSLNNIVQGTKSRLNIKPESIENKAIDEYKADQDSDEEIKNIAIAAIGLTLGVIGAVATGGGAIMLAATAGSAVLSTAQLVSVLDDYKVEASAANTAMDKASSVAQSDPTLFWVAVELIAAGLDIYGAGKAFKNVAGPIRRALAARRAVLAAEQAAGGTAQAAEAVGEASQAAKAEMQELAKSIEEMEAAARGAGVPDNAVKNIRQQVEGPVKGYIPSPDKPLSSAGFKGSLAEKGAGFGVFDGYVPGVSDPVVIKVYPDTDEFKEVFARELAGARAAGQTGIGPKCYGEVSVGPGKKAFAMEKVSGSMPEVTGIDELQDAVAKAATPDEAARAQAALDKAMAEAAQTAKTINKVTIQDVRAYGERVLQKGTYIKGDLQGLVDGGGRWRPIDFQGHFPLPDKVKDPAGYAKALSDHEFQLQQQIDMLMREAPKPLPDAPVGTLPHYKLPPGSPGGTPVQPYRSSEQLQTPDGIPSTHDGRPTTEHEGGATAFGQLTVATDHATGNTDLADRIAAKSGGGAPLEDGLAAEFGDRLGTDLSGVRVHTDSEAADLNQAVNAVAFTTGQDIFFSPGTYAPGSAEGRRLLAHEIAHTVQQSAGPVEGTPAAGGISVSDPADSFEQAAEATAEKLSAPIDRSPDGNNAEMVGSAASAALEVRQGVGILEGVVQRQETEPPGDGPLPLDEDAGGGTITIDEQGVTQAVYNAPSFVTKDEVVTPVADSKPGEDLVDVTGKVVATFKVDIKITLPTVPSNLSACQKERVKDAIDNKLSPHEDQHAAAMRKFDGPFEKTIEVKRVPKAKAIEKLTEAAKKAVDEEGARRKKEAQDASDALDKPPFVIVVDLDCEDKKSTFDMPIGPGSTDEPEPFTMLVAGEPVQTMPVQRFISDTNIPGPKPPPGTPEEIQAAIDAHDKGMIKAIHDFSRATSTQKQAMINILLEGWTGPFDENALNRIWGTFGDGLLNLDANWADLFIRCLEAGAEVKRIPPASGLEENFKHEVKGVAISHLNSNRDYLVAEAERLAAPEGYEPGSVGPTNSAAADAKIEEQQKFAELLLEAQKQQQELRKIPVGWKPMQAEQYGQPDEGEVDTSDYEYFDPTGQKFQPYDDEPGVKMAHWGDVKKQWDELGVAMAKMTDDNPGLYALMVSGKLNDFPKASPEEGRNQLQESFKEVAENIYETAQSISEDDLDYRDLLPIHAQVKAGPGASGIDWSKPFPKRMIEGQILADYKADADLLNDALGGVAFLAFLVAEIASGGLATLIPLIVGVAASAAPAAMSWEKYGDLSTAADTAVKSGTELVHKEQLSAVMIEAIINTASAFLDLYGAGKTVRTKLIRPKDLLEGVSAAGRAYGGLKELDRMPKAEAADAAAKAIDELGVAGAVSKSGKSAEELLYVIPADSPAYARIKAYLALTKEGAKGVSAKLATLSLDLAEKRITRDEADQVVLLAIDSMGPVDVIQQTGGWQKLATMLGNESAAGRRLNAWRTSLWEDLRAYINSLDLDPGELENIKRTGSQGSFGSDLDMSSLGSLSADHREQARSFMAGRVGVEPGKLHSILYADFFTDPRRMHLLDQLPAEARAKIAASQARKEQQMMLNLMYQDALAHGDDATAKSVKEMMDQANVPLVKVEPVSKAEISAFEREIDKLQREFIDSTDAGRKSEIVEQIADMQAKINSTEGGGYFTSGGVRREVTEREKIGDFAPGGAAPAMAIPQRLTALLDNALKLFHAAQGLPVAATTEQLAGTLKAVGKYGSRFTAEFGKDGLAVAMKIPAEGRFTSLADRFETWLLQARFDPAAPATVAALEKKAAQDSTVKVMSLQTRLELKGEGEALLRELQASIGDFRQVLYEAHGALTKEAGLAKLPANYAATQSYLLIQGKLLMIQDASAHLIAGVIRGLDVADEAAEAATDLPGGAASPGDTNQGAGQPAAGSANQP